MAYVRHPHLGEDDDDGTSSSNSSVEAELPALADGYDSSDSGAWEACQNDGYDDVLPEIERCHSSVPADAQDGCTIMSRPFYKSCVSPLQAICTNQMLSAITRGSFISQSLSLSFYRAVHGMGCEWGS